MKAARFLACVVVVAVCALSLSANWLAPAGYAKQFRDSPSVLRPPAPTCLAPMNSAATASHASFTARAFRFC